MIKFCEICLSSILDKSELILSCSCKFCESCIYEYINYNLKEKIVDLYSPILKCPNENCPHILNMTDMKLQLDYENQQKINEALLLKYFQESTDIRNCPSSSCSYYGFIKMESCDSMLECLKCGEKWEDKYQQSMKKKIITNIKHIVLGKNEVFSTFYEEFFTKACPSCGIAISKNGGCFHMTCQKCAFEFCWICTQNYKNHSSSICTISLTIKMIIIIAWIVFGFWKLGLVEYVVKFFRLLVNFLVKFILFYNGFFTLLIYFIHNIGGYYKYNGRREGIFGVSTLIIILTGFVSVMYLYGCFLECFLFILSEIFIVIGGITFGLIFNLFWSRWLFQVE